MSNVQAVLEYRKRRKANLVKIAGGKCCLCGYNKYQGALEFHHINSDEKEYALGADGICHSLEKDLHELQKCILVCANCHREVHAGFFSSKDLYSKQNFNQEYIDYLLSLREKKEYFCKKCGKQLTNKNKNMLCRNCSNELKRIIERPTRQELKNLIRTTSFTEIAKHFSVSDNAIRKWCDSYNLPRKVSDIKKYSDIEWASI